MATTKKEGAPVAKERPSRSSLTPTTMQKPRARATKPSSPAGSSSEKDDPAVPTSQRKPIPNYLKPTFSSSPDAVKPAKAPPAGATRGPQKSMPGKKGSDAKPPPQRTSSFNPPKQQKPSLSSRPSFSERTPSKGKATSHLSLKVDTAHRRKLSGGARSRCSSATSSANVSETSSPKAMTEETLSNEDKEAALDILNLDLEEHVLLEIAPVADKTAPAHEEEVTAFAEHEHVVSPVVPDEDAGKAQEEHDSEEMGKEEEEDAVEEEDHHEEVPAVEVGEKEVEEKPGEADEQAVVEDSGGPDGEDAVAEKVEAGEGEKEGAGMEVDGGGQRVTVKVEEAAAAPAAREKRKEAAPQQGKKEAPPAYNDVIEETASRLVEKRKSKVQALVGAFETVIVLDSGGQAQ